MKTIIPPKIKELDAPSAIILSWKAGKKTYSLFKSYNTPIALAVGNGNGWLENIYAVRTSNPKARSKSTMRGYKAFLRDICADEKTYAIDKLPEVEVEL